MEIALSRIAPIIFLLFFCFSESRAADLLSVYHNALNYDAQFAASRAQHEAAAQQEPQALAGLLPSLSLSAESSWTNEDTKYRISNTDPITNRYNDRGWSAKLSQPVFRWQNWAAYKQSQIATAAAVIELQKSRQDLILRVAKAYFDVLLANESVAANKAELELSAHNLPKRSGDLL
jgi:outer membrane protein